jgi:carbon monoxide dehydrogenase subunit G
MELIGNRVIATDRQTIWQALNDVEVLQACIPGCKEMTGTVNDGFEAVVTVKVGPMKVTFKGVVTLTDIVESQSYRIAGVGKGGAAGFAKGAALVRLEDVEGGTNLIYEVEAKVGGKLAQMGSRVVQSVAKKFADEFFEKFDMMVAPNKKIQETVPETNGIVEKPKKKWLKKLTGQNQ